MYKWICCILLLCVAGCGTTSFLVTPVKPSYDLEEVVLAGGSKGKIVVIPISGMIANAQTSVLLEPPDNPMSLFQQQLDKIAEDGGVSAIVLRVNSPGGTVSGSDTMYTVLQRFKQKYKIPVVVSTQEVCASGAYYVSCAADRIIVQPTSVVGSIGVIFETFDASGTMNMIGLKSDAVKSGVHKDMGSPFKALNPDDRKLMQEMVDEYFVRFKEVVRQNRAIKEENFAMITDGRVFSGRRAVELGIADQTGLLEDAFDVARQLSGKPKAKVVTYRRPYAYSGSIYAASSTPQPRANVLQLQLPGERSLLPTGFYYLWQP